MNSPITTSSLSATEAAKLIRRDLKAAFPTITFTVRASSGRGHSVDIAYVDGPTKQAVEAVAFAYGQRGFNSSDDSTHYVDGQVAKLTADGIVAPTYRGFVFVSRRFSGAALEAMGFASETEMVYAERGDSRVRDLEHWDFTHGYGARTIIVGCY